jgi:hypothetical protein
MNRMKRVVTDVSVSVLAGLLFVATAGASQDPPRRSGMPGVIDLGQPGALQALARDNPQHYAKIERILADVTRRPPQTVPRWMNAEFGARQVSFPSLLKTSDPAQRSLSFTLDDTRYEAVVRVPARWSFAR